MASGVMWNSTSVPSPRRSAGDQRGGGGRGGGWGGAGGGGGGGGGARGRGGGGGGVGGGGGGWGGAVPSASGPGALDKYRPRARPDLARHRDPGRGTQIGEGAGRREFADLVAARSMTTCPPAPARQARSRTGKRRSGSFSAAASRDPAKRTSVPPPSIHSITAPARVRAKCRHRPSR